MKILNAISTISLLTAAALAAHAAAMLSVTNMNALEGLAPITALGNTDAGKAALASNFTITGDIQSGAAKQPLLLSFPVSSSRRCATPSSLALPMNWPTALVASSDPPIRRRPLTRLWTIART